MLNFFKGLFLFFVFLTFFGIVGAEASYNEAEDSLGYSISYPWDNKTDFVKKYSMELYVLSNGYEVPGMYEAGLALFTLQNTYFSSNDVFLCKYPNGSLTGVQIVDRCTFVPEFFIKPYGGIGLYLAYYQDRGEINGYYKEGRGVSIGIPLELGVDITLLSKLKVIVGYDGYLCCSWVTRDKLVWTQIFSILTGFTGAPKICVGLSF